MVMNVHGKPMKTIWVHPERPGTVQLIDQRALPHKLFIEDVSSFESMLIAIRDMHVRGAPLIGVAAAFGMALAADSLSDSDWQNSLARDADSMRAARPTAVNLAWAVDQQMQVVSSHTSLQACREALWQKAQWIVDSDEKQCFAIGEHGLILLEEISARKKGEPINILTHCNAGWLACVNFGTATAPMYLAHEAQIPIHVWVDETRPRNQGAKLTAWELGQHGIHHTLIPDNAGGHLMQHGMVDIVIVGADRVAANGDAANKIGTYLKALAAFDNKVPFYVAMPSSTIDWNIQNGVYEIPIETRSEDEVRRMDGLLPNGLQGEVLICPESTQALNYGFDVTPARLITGLITERGVCDASEEGLRRLYPEHVKC